MKTRLILLAAFVLAGAPATAEMLVATRTVPAQTVVGATDVSLAAGDLPGVHTDIAAAIGLETRVTLYPGRPVRLGDLGPAAVVERNEIVTLRFRSGALVIETEGRALDRGPAGGGIRVMNLASRTIVSGIVATAGLVEVGK